MNEIDVRIESLKRNIKQYNGKVIALYGIKDNAKRILEELKDQNIVALIDKDVVGETVFGKQTVALEDSLTLGVEVIIIAAEMKSSVIVSKRIFSFCMENNIILLNMYGKEERLLKELHSTQFCLKESSFADLLRKRIGSTEAIIVQLTNVLCHFVYNSKEEFFCAIGEKNGQQAFAEGRSLAEKKCRQQIYSIKDIYDIYETMVYPQKVNHKELCDLEEQMWIDSFVPNAELIAIINQAIEAGKGVYLVSDLKLSRNGIDKLLRKVGILEKAVILQENLCKKTFSNGALRFAEDIEKTLYVGTDMGYNSMLALSYDMEVILVEDQSREKSEPVPKVQKHLTKSKNPQVSILIVSSGTESNCKECYDSVLTNTINTEFELFILENDGEKIPDIRGKYVAILRDNTLVQFNWLAPMIHLLENDDTIGMVGSKIISPEETLLEAGGILWPDGTEESYGKGRNPECSEYNYVKEVDYVSTVSVAIRTPFWNELVGSGNCLLNLNNQVTELSKEVRKRGKKIVFQPASTVIFCGTGDVFYEAKDFENNKKRFATRERKGNRKLVVFFSKRVPTIDCDAGSVTIFSYLMLFVRKGYIVKYVPADFLYSPRYSFALEQNGIEVLHGDFYRKNITAWLLENKEEINYSLINYPQCGELFVGILSNIGIKTCYYGHDLHYLRKQREYELYKNKKDLEESNYYYAVEKKLIDEADIVYYPSYIEEEIVKKEFGKKNVKAIPAYVYHEAKSEKAYCPKNRKGIMFIGGYNHLPNVDAVLWFAREIYPNISPNGEIPFYIVGSNEPPEIQQLDAQGIIHKGYVTNEELDILYDEVKLVVVPLRYGAGVKGKIIDTLYRGVPVVSTSVGVEGIQEAKQYISVVDDALIFGEKITELYYDDEKLLEASKGYAEIIKKYFSEEAAWNIIGKDFGGFDAK